jgi:hypothetical protein
MSTLVLALCVLAGQAKKPAPLGDVNVRRVFAEKAYIVDGDLLIAAPVVFPEGAVVYLKAGATVRVLADVSVKGSTANPVTFVAEKGKPWEGLQLDATATLTGVRVVGATTGVVVAKNIPALLKGCSLLNCQTGVRVLRNSMVSSAAPPPKKKADKDEPVPLRGFRMEDCWIFGCKQAGVYLEDLASAELEGCTIANCGEGIYCRYANRVTMTGSVLTRNGVALKTQWQETLLKVSKSNVVDNQVAVFMSSMRDLDLKGNYWGGAPRIQYGKERDMGRVDYSSPLKKPAEAGSTVVLKRLPKFR